MEWIAPVLTSLGVAIFIPVLNWFSNRKAAENKEKRDNFDTIVERLDSENKNLREETKLLIARVAHLEALCDVDVPYPVWSLGLGGEYRWVNGAFESQILIPLGKTASDILGKRPGDIWDPAVSTVLMRLGSKASFSFDSRLTGTRFVYQHSLYHGPRPVGTMGIALPE